MVNLWDEFFTLREFGQFFLGCNLKVKILLIFSKELSTSGVFLMVHFLAFMRVLAKKVTYPTLTRVKGFVCKISRVARI